MKENFKTFNKGNDEKILYNDIKNISMTKPIVLG